jgi:hypothetical protein
LETTRIIDNIAKCHARGRLPRIRSQGYSPPATSYVQNPKRVEWTMLMNVPERVVGGGMDDYAYSNVLGK